MQTHRCCAFVVFAASIALIVRPEPLGASSADAVPTRLSRACDADEGRLPDAVQIERSLLARIKVMLKSSPTFREQCLRVAATRLLYIRVSLKGSLVDYRFRARTRILRFHSGVIIGEVEIRTTWAPDEWIAHEFEHVLEQVDRVPLVELAARSDGVWRTADEMFETERAIRAGRTVVEEIRRAQKARADGFVE